MMKKIDEALKSYNERYYRERLDSVVINNFGESLKKYAKEINNAVQQNENEEFFKNIVNDFLKTNFYKDERYSINTVKNIDSAIKYDGQLRALIETKKPNNKAEMLSVGTINRKGLWELVYYYLDVTRDTAGHKVCIKSDVEIRRLIVTDAVEWFLFDANEIEKYCSGYLENQFLKYCNGQLNYAKDISKFHQEIRSYLDKSNINEKMNYVHFNLGELYKKKREWKNLYKIFDQCFLLKNAYIPSEKAHVLNNKFYQELLYIMGLKEIKKDGKNVILIDNEIRNSLAEQVYRKYVDDKEMQEDMAFEKTFELIIIWVNRLLFIKLFEGQLIAFNSKEQCYHILDNEKIESFQNLQNLFFNVLGKRERDNTPFYEKFKMIPYLNSSLFEKQEIEKKDITINDLKNELLVIKPHSVLASRRVKELSLLRYIIDFLNSYDFGAHVLEDGSLEQSQDIIDASVLGLIFEKINGYKDGSFYTPSEITEYMTKETLERVVIEKINRDQRWECKSLDDLKFEIGLINNMELCQRLNEIINSIRICDPAVGSGHFLVSALNRLIAIKAELGIIFIHGTSRLLRDYDIFVKDDTLVVEDAQGEDFIYDKVSVSSQQIQETLFVEKKTIIEECLFGVDLNAKAVHICQLRLWIELLKSAYYKKGVMETLPNIDIDIKVGNSLISKLNFDIGKQVGKKDARVSLDIGAQKLLKEYKKSVKAYKSESNKHQKEKIKSTIISLKENMYSQYFQLSLFDDWQIYNDEYKMYGNALEWAIEFPEILSEDGKFLGFDCIIGNPPYIQLQSMHDEAKKLSQMKYETYAKTGDIYCLFYELGYKLLKQDGILAFITSNKWMKAGYGEALREFFLNKVNVYLLIDFAGTKIFDSATVDVNILMFRKGKYQKETFSGIANKECLDNLSVFVKHKTFLNEFQHNAPWVILSPVEQSIKQKIEAIGTPLKEWDINIYRGILTGYNDAFIINGKVRKHLIEQDEKSAEIIRPILRGRDVKKYTYEFADLYIIATFPSLHYDINLYPAVKEYLLSFGIERLEQTGLVHCTNGVNVKSRKKTHNQWFETQDSINYWDDFSKQKIVWGNLCLSAQYAMVEAGMYINAPAPFIASDDYYLLAALNSKIADWYVRSLGVTRNGGYFEYKPMFVEKIPVVRNLPCDVVEKITKAAYKLQTEGGGDRNSSDMEKYLNECFYSIYNLTTAEIAFIEE